VRINQFLINLSKREGTVINAYHDSIAKQVECLNCQRPISARQFMDALHITRYNSAMAGCYLERYKNA